MDFKRPARGAPGTGRGGLLCLLALGVLLSGCGGGQAQPASVPEDAAPAAVEPVQTAARPGETVSTGLFRFTLDAAQLTLALSNEIDDQYALPKAYDPQQDQKNPYVAQVGHTFVALTYTVENISRAAEEFHRSGGFATVGYQGVDYPVKVQDCAYWLYADKQILDQGKMKTEKAQVWHRNPSSNFLLSTAAKETRRAYADLKVEADDLRDGFTLTVDVPGVDGSESFLYEIPAQAAQGNAEIETKE